MSGIKAFFLFDATSRTNLVVTEHGIAAAREGSKGLLAPPVRMADASGNPAPPMDAAPVPISIVHGWHDELIAATDVVAWAQPRNARLLLVDDGHRLSAHVHDSAEAFASQLRALAA